MNLVDVAIILMVISAIFRGRDIGLVRQLFSTAGFVGGLFLGVLLEPHTVTLVHSATSRSVITLVTTLGCAFILLAIGEYLGALLKHRVQRHRINGLDRWLGSAVGVVTLLAVVWLAAAIVTTLPYPKAQSEIRGSYILSTLDKSLPPAPNVIAGLSRLVDPNGFPQVFTGAEPEPAHTNVPGISTALQKAIDKDAVSVVQLKGLGCGGIVEGSGFVAGPDLVITNAHYCQLHRAS